MKKNTLLLIVTAGLIFASAGCTSQESQDEQAPIENADIEKIDSLEDGDGVAIAEPLGDAPAAEDDLSLEASLDEPMIATENTTTIAADSPAPEGEAPPPPPTMDESSLNLDDSPAPTTDIAAATEAPPVETSFTETPPPPAVEAPAEPLAELTETPVMDTTASSSFDSYSEPFAATPVAAKPGIGALKKVATTVPYQTKDGGWVNTVYVARPNEKLVDISQKIYGADRTAEIKQIAENRYLKSRAVKPGDKIYYVSPNRPDDSSKTMLYFEDMGMVPETYVARKGESLRKVAKELLGYDNAWKELWTSNQIESKTSLKEGETVRYWKSMDATTVAEAPASLVDASQAPVPTAQTAPPEPLPPPPADANAAMPPMPPPTDDMAAPPADVPPPFDDVAAAPPPPPPPADDAFAAPPPPPVDDMAAAPVDDEAGGKPRVNLDEEAANEEAAGGLDTETLASMGALGVLVALLAFVIIRKKKQKSQMNNLEMNA